MKSYLIAYSIIRKEKVTDHFAVFSDKHKKRKAKKLYKIVLRRADLYTANMCKIKKTTEHYE